MSNLVTIGKVIKQGVCYLKKQKGYLVINVFGLSIGIAFSIFIGLFINYELSYDKFNEKRDRIYQLVLSVKINGPESLTSSTCLPVGPAMLKEFPEVENMCRINIWNKTVVKNKEQGFTERAFVLADSTFFNVFSAKLLLGDRRTALNAPHKMVISKSTAVKIFGDEDPIGKSLQVSTDTVPYTITGVMEDIPKTSHFDANIVGSLTTSSSINEKYWLAGRFNTYILLKPKASAQVMDVKLAELVKRNVEVELVKYLKTTYDDFISKGNKYRLYLQPLTAIHLNGEVKQAVKPANDSRYLWIFGSFGVLIVVIAAINYMNLSTAQSLKRTKEIGVKKVAGSSRGMLIGQFLSESILLSFLSFLIAVVVVKFSLPFLNNLLQLNLGLDLFDNWFTIPMLIALAIFIGLIAGSYPAFYLSSFNPNILFKGSKAMKNGRLRNVLVVIQFAISIMFIIGTIVMFHQIKHLLNKDLGFSKDHLIVIERANAIGNQMEAFKETLGKIREVKSVSASTDVPFHSNNQINVKIENREDESTLVRVAWVDYDFLKTYDLKMTSGRFFDEAFATDKDACIFNESAIKQLGISTPLSTRIMDRSSTLQDIFYSPIIGVVSNFHFESLRSDISPYLLWFIRERDWNCVSVKLSDKADANTISEIEQVWKKFTANDPMQFFFVDEDFEQQFKVEKQSASLALLLTVLIIFIASLGLFGLTSYTVLQRTKEMGVRKVMGATASNLFILISKEIVLLVCISTLIAWPIIYFISTSWLQNYHYRIGLPVFDFILGFIIAITIAVITISYRTIKAVKANPSDSLRYE